MFQIASAYLYAIAWGPEWGVVAGLQKSEEKQLEDFKNSILIQMGKQETRHVMPSNTIGTSSIRGVKQCNMSATGTLYPFWQDYDSILKGNRNVVRCLFAYTSHTRIRLHQQDVVIHFRHDEALRNILKMALAFPDVKYYIGAWTELNNTIVGGVRQTWLLLEPGLEKTLAVKVIMRSLNALIAGGSKQDDHDLGVHAQNVILSTGTYSFMIAYLSTGQRIHMPYCSNAAVGWYGAGNMFIDDYERVVFHDYCADSVRGKSASEVMSVDSLYQRDVLRAKGAAHVCPMTMPQ